jgi:acetyl-CoA C-acetyltransferase
MRSVSVVGIGQLPVRKQHDLGLAAMGAQAVHLAMQDAGVEHVDALYVGNMLSDELQSQKHLGALVADAAGLVGVEALSAGAASAAGAAALRLGYLAVASGDLDLVAVVGVEKMSEGAAVPALSKALDGILEVPYGATLISRNAELMQMYIDTYAVPEDAFSNFAVNAHNNGRHNPNALFRQRVSARKVRTSRVVSGPLRLYDASPLCDGAAAVILAPTEQARAFSKHPVKLLSCTVATDHFRVEDRPNPLWLQAAEDSAREALLRANVNLNEIDIFEVHDAFSIMAALQLEAAGFAAPGEGWKLAADKEIYRRGKVPIATMGGLKARGHPIGATALYQTCEIVLQLTGRAGQNQVKQANVAMMQSVGGAAATMLTHIYSN